MDVPQWSPTGWVLLDSWSSYRSRNVCKGNGVGFRLIDECPTLVSEWLGLVKGKYGCTLIDFGVGFRRVRCIWPIVLGSALLDTRLYLTFTIMFVEVCILTRETSSKDSIWCRIK